MKINDKIVNTYLSGKPIDIFKDEWYFTNSQVAGQIGKNIFTPPAYTDEQKAKVQEIHSILLQTVQSFEPINIPIWNELFPDWKEVFSNVSVDLILGFPDPHDATVESDDSGKRRIIFDLACWTKYLGYDIAAITRNLLTHELCHILIGKHIPHIDEDMESPNYLTALDALTFHEAFAHLISYDAMEIDEVDWNGPELQKVREKSSATMHKALSSTDEKEQEHYLYTAQCGSYFDKYACMAGMLYLAEQWQKGGTQALKTCFAEGYHGFAEKCSETASQFDIITSSDLTLKLIQKHPGNNGMLLFCHYDIINPANQTIGNIRIRIGHNFHSYYNGHIGYEIFKEYRGSGYACKACQMALDIPRFHNMDFIYLACDESNISSYKTIEKLGAELVEICDVPKEYFAWHEGMERRRIYKLDL